MCYVLRAGHLTQQPFQGIAVVKPLGFTEFLHGENCYAFFPDPLSVLVPQALKKALRRFLVLRAGLEPAPPNGEEILSLSCLPFHHPSIVHTLRPGRESNSRIGVLQTPTLPLGYQAEKQNVTKIY